MTNFKGTKGKWEVLLTSEVDSPLDIAIKCEKKDCIAWVYSKSNYKHLNGKANALLISKAPEMLEMLEYLVENDYILNLYNVKKVKQLIKEATEL